MFMRDLSIKENNITKEIKAFINKLKCDIAEHIGYHDFENEEDRIETAQKLLGLNELEFLALYLSNHDYGYGAVSRIIDTVNNEYPLPFEVDHEILQEEQSVKKAIL